MTKQDPESTKFVSRPTFRPSEVSFFKTAIALSSHHVRTGMNIRGNSKGVRRAWEGFPLARRGRSVGLSRPVVRRAAVASPGPCRHNARTPASSTLVSPRHTGTYVSFPPI
jgi:hypothetical protein